MKRYEVDGDPDFQSPTTVEANSPEHAAEVYTHQSYDDGWSDHWTAYVRSVDGDAASPAGEVVHVEVFTQHALIVTTSCKRTRKDGAL